MLFHYVYFNNLRYLIKNDLSFLSATHDFQQALDIDDNYQKAKEGMQKVQKLKKQASKRDYYKILGIKRSATKKEVSKAYRWEHREQTLDWAPHEAWCFGVTLLPLSLEKYSSTWSLLFRIISNSMRSNIVLVFITIFLSQKTTCNSFTFTQTIKVMMYVF